MKCLLTFVLIAMIIFSLDTLMANAAGGRGMSGVRRRHTRVVHVHDKPQEEQRNAILVTLSDEQLGSFYRSVEVIRSGIATGKISYDNAMTALSDITKPAEKVGE